MSGTVCDAVYTDMKEVRLFYEAALRQTGFPARRFKECAAPFVPNIRILWYGTREEGSLRRSSSQDRDP